MLTVTKSGIGRLKGASCDPLYSKANRSHGTGADVMKRIAAPMIGGMVSSTILTLLVIPVIYALWRWRNFSRKTQH